MDDEKMTIRFTHTEKWEDAWFRKLKPVEKLLFLYLCDRCDIAGIWEIDLELAAFVMGIDLEAAEGAMKGLGRGLVKLDSEHYLIKNFIKRQRNFPLNPENSAHRGIINRLQKYKENACVKQLLEGATKGLSSPIGNSKGNSKGKGYSDDFESFWTVYPKKVGKGAAFRAWKKINPSQKLQFKIYDAVRQQAATSQWTKENGQYIPNPATWLNQSRFDDTGIEKPKPKVEMCIICRKNPTTMDNKYCSPECYRESL